MSAVYLQIVANIVHVNFYGFILNIDKEHYKAWYLALSRNGDVIIFSHPPKLIHGCWTCEEGFHSSSLRVADIWNYQIPGLGSWILETWNQRYYMISDFPEVEMQ